MSTNEILTCGFVFLGSAILRLSGADPMIGGELLPLSTILLLLSGLPLAFTLLKGYGHWVPDFFRWIYRVSQPDPHQK